MSMAAITIAAVAANPKCAFVGKSNIRQYGDQEKLIAGSNQKGDKDHRDGAIHANRRVKNRMRTMGGKTTQHGALLHFELQLSSI
jgi:hypothetical protein